MFFHADCIGFRNTAAFNPVSFSAVRDAGARTSWVPLFRSRLRSGYTLSMRIHKPSITVPDCEKHRGRLSGEFYGRIGRITYYRDKALALVRKMAGPKFLSQPPN